MSAIRVLIYADETDSHQLAEIRFEKIRQIDGQLWEYQAQIAVDTGPEFHFFTRTLNHYRDRDNVLGLLDSLMNEIKLTETMMSGKRKSRQAKRTPWRQLGSVFDA